MPYINKCENTVLYRANSHLGWCMMVAKSSNQVNLLCKYPQSVPLFVLAVGRLGEVCSQIILLDLNEY